MPDMPSIVLSIDFDGTLVDGQGQIHPNDRAILRSEQRVIFVPATGRALPSVRRTFEANALFREEPIPFPLVLQNGAALYGPGETLQRYRPLPQQVQDALVAAAHAHGDVTSYFYTPEGLYRLWPSPYGARMEQRFDLDPVPFDTAGPNARFSKLMCISGEPASLHAIAADLQDLPVTPAYSMPTVMEVNLTGVDKGEGAVALLENLGLVQARLIAAGDGENDLGLFERAELAFAPSTSLPHVKARATHVIDVQGTGLLTPILDFLL
jgi:5-amino-6-(5-phospho-D-ribitylamino)uracil phosphatase